MEWLVSRFESAISFGDSHDTGAYDQEIEKKELLFNLIRKEAPHLLILAGDIFDPWVASWDQIMHGVFYNMLYTEIAWRMRNGLGTVYLPRNHDYNPPKELFMDPLHYNYPHCFGTDVQDGLYVEAPNLTTIVRGRTYKWVHGWEYDFTWGGIGKIPGIYPVAFWIAENAPWLMIPLYRRLFGGGASSPGIQRTAIEGLVRDVEALEDLEDDPLLESYSCESKQWLDQAMDRWSLHVALVHDRARMAAEKSNIVHIMQHTHYPLDYDGLICDGGSLKEDHSFIQVLDQPRVLFIGDKDDDREIGTS